MDWDFIQQWLAVLDSLSYYEILRANESSSADELKARFHAFATDFHPDAHAGRPRHERDAIALIFKRGNEAYRVLGNPALRARYDAALGQGDVRPSALLSLAAPAESAPPPPKGPDRMRHPNARQFVMRAEELFAKGDPKQAKIQLTLAMHMDRGNPALETFLKEIEAAIIRLIEEEKKKWQRNT
jgi:curved DNA-binding protein CbpA